MSEPHQPPTHGSDAAESGAVVLVVLGGEGPASRPPLPERVTVVAADSGAELAVALGLPVDHLVGDLDSLDAEVATRLEAGGTLVTRHPRDKDATDGALALEVAVGLAPDRIIVLGGHGGRLDHAVAVLGTLVEVAAPGRRVEAWMGEAHVVVVVDGVEVDTRPGEVVSLVPLHGPVDGVRTAGLRWVLDDEPLPVGTTRGVSNEALGARVSVRVRSGRLLLIRPHALAPEDRR